MMPKISLYVHFPWCLNKCPYCDFNAYHAPKIIPQEAYYQKLIADLLFEKEYLKNRKIISVYFGGGTPSLLAPTYLQKFITFLKNNFNLAEKAEISLEANPETLTYDYLAKIRESINRLSLGGQSFSPETLKILKRHHTAEEIINAIENAKKLQFININLDLIYGTPQQNCEKIITDLKTAISLEPDQISWYQLMIEEGSVFYKTHPLLPADEEIYKANILGNKLLEENGFEHYEISGYAKRGKRCLHNQQYWLFNDYIGLGAGSHSKITILQKIYRFEKEKIPQKYLENPPSRQNFQEVPITDLPFEFLLNRCRLLNNKIYFTEFENKTFCLKEMLIPPLEKAQKGGFIQLFPDGFTLTDFGKNFINDFLLLFISPTNDQKKF